MFSSGLIFWHWLVLAMLLLLLELFAPAAFFIWIGGAAALVGLIVMILPGLSWQIQCIVFAALSITTVVIGRRFFRRDQQQTTSTLNRRGEQYLGRRFVLDEAITNGTGRVRVDDSYWRIVGPDLPSGTTVVVESVDGASLKVAEA